MRWIDEQGIHVPIVDHHERNRTVFVVHGKPERRGRQESADRLSNRSAIGGREKVMGRINRATPDRERAITVFVAGTTDRNHVHRDTTPLCDHYRRDRDGFVLTDGELGELLDHQYVRMSDRVIDYRGNSLEAVLGVEVGGLEAVRREHDLPAAASPCLTLRRRQQRGAQPVPAITLGDP